MTALVNGSSIADSALPAPTIPTTAIPTLAPIANRPLAERLAARVSCSLEEVAAFASVRAALDAMEAQLFAGRRVTVARPSGDAIAAAAWRSARTAREVAARPLDELVAAARESDVLVLSSPVVAADGGVSTLLSPRELLLLRSRAPRPVIVLDLLEEERARTPLTQPALLLPGTVVLRGFGEFWRTSGAEGVADLAFAVGPRDLVSSLAAPPLPSTIEASACAALDLPDIDRAVRASAGAVQQPAPAGTPTACPPTQPR